MTDDDQLKQLVEQTRERHEEREQEIAEFHEAVKEESDAVVLETTCNLAGDIVVDISAKRNGDLMDRMGHIEERLEYVETEERGTYKITEAADDAAQLLADVVDDPAFTKDEFYTVYQSEGLDELGKMLRRVFNSLEQEGERLQGAADGFRGHQ